MSVTLPPDIQESKPQETDSLPATTAEASTPAAPPRPETKTKPPRLMALDAFRGLTIFGMLLVNNIALDEATPRSLTHAEWTGRVHLADLVFPWFLLAVGCALPFSFASHIRRGGSRFDWVRKALGRAVLLLLLGCLVDSTVARQPYLGLGVLQIIGLASLVGALGCLVSRQWGRAALAGALLIGYWALIRLFPVPGVGAGYFEEETNAVRHLNDTILNPLGLRGLLSMAPTGALVVIGSLFGEVLRASGMRTGRKLLTLLAGGGGLTLLGTLWSLDLPMNKPVWTPPYILFTGGIGLIVMVVLFLTTDATPDGRIRNWALPLVVFGSNAIVAYVVPILVKINVLQTWQWRPAGSAAAVSVEQALREWCFASAGRIGGGWLYTLGYIGFWWLVLAYLYRKQIFLRV